MSFLRRRVGCAGIASTLVLVGCCVWASVASAAVTPGWECVPTTAGQAVVSGGTGNVPSCGGGTTPVLAPTYVASGVGGKPTVEFSALNVQVVSGSGSTNGVVNGEGNLVMGYDEKPGTQTGSNNLILGYGQSYSSYGSIVGGSYNASTGPFTDVFGESDRASAYAASVTGGIHNAAVGTNSLVAGGNDSKASGSFSSVLGGFENSTTASEAVVVGGESNVAGNNSATILGGDGNSTSASCQAIPAAPGSC
jgi:hypothetical protein